MARSMSLHSLEHQLNPYKPPLWGKSWFEEVTQTHKDALAYLLCLSVLAGHHECTGLKIIKKFDKWVGKQATFQTSLKQTSGSRRGSPWWAANSFPQILFSRTLLRRQKSHGRRLHFTQRPSGTHQLLLLKPFIIAALKQLFSITPSVLTKGT